MFLNRDSYKILCQILFLRALEGFCAGWIGSNLNQNCCLDVSEGFM